MKFRAFLVDVSTSQFRSKEYFGSFFQGSVNPSYDVYNIILMKITLNFYFLKNALYFMNECSFKTNKVRLNYFLILKRPFWTNNSEKMTFS